MATIKSQMTLNDGMSAVLKKMTAALDTTLAAFERVQRASSRAVDAAGIEAARGALTEAGRAVDEMADGYRRAAQEEERLNDGIRRGTSAMDGMVRKVASLVGAYASLSAVKGFVTDALSAADVQIGAQVQLKTVMGNMGTLDYYGQILDKAGAIQGRGIYGDEAMIAGAGELATYFSDGQAILSMMDTLANYAAGMSGGGVLDTTAMVDYATGLGKIMSGSYDAMTKKGFAFTDAQKAIIEGTATQAQIAAELGEEYLSMSRDMQAAAAIDAVIAEGWGGLYEAMSSTPRSKLVQLNNTLGDIKENVGAGIYPAVVRFVDVIQTNTPQIEAAAMRLASALSLAIQLLTGVVEGAIAFGTAAADHWSWIGPIIMGVVGALLALEAAQLACAAADWIGTSAKIAKAIATGAETVALHGEIIATGKAAAAQWGLNAAMLANPITWVILLVIALVAVLLLLWENCEGFRNFMVDMYAGQTKALGRFYNSVIVPIANGAVDLQHMVMDAVANFVTFVINAFADMAVFVLERFDAILTGAKAFAGLYNKIAGALGGETIDIDYAYSVPGVGAAREAALSAVQGWREEGKFRYAPELDLSAFDQQVDSIADGAREFSIVGWIGEQMTGLLGSVEGYAGEGLLPDSLGGDVSDIADNTGGMAQALEISGEELKYLRDIAERDAVNRFTTAEVKIDMTGMTNKIDGGADLDGVIRELTDGFADALVTAAEGVHA